MDHQPDSYTVVVFRGATAKPLRLSLSRLFVKRAMIVGVVLAIVQVAFMAQYVIQTGEVWELKEIRQELVTAREQNTSFSVSLEDLKRRVLAMKEVNEKLRVMLGIESLKPEDYLNGQGGEETPITDVLPGLEQNGPSPAAGTEPKAEGKEGGEPEQANATPTPNTTEPDLVSKLRQRIVWLQNEALIQERSLDELFDVAQERSDRWNHTPSVWPVKGWVTSGFGPRISPFTGQLAMHDGLDIGAQPNAPVYAPANGVVSAVGSDPKMGNVVAIEHGYGLESQYGHLTKALVKQGQKVKRGDLIGLVGNTGLSTGPHLHYMVKVNERPVNPQRYILN